MLCDGCTAVSFCLSNLGDGDGGRLMDAEHKMLKIKCGANKALHGSCGLLILTHTVSMAIIDFINNYCIIILIQQLDWKSCAEYVDMNERVFK